MEVLKREEEELPIPNAWRQTFVDVLTAFKDGDFRLENKIARVHALAEHDAERISVNIKDYGDELISLSDETWNTSIYRWMGDYWEVLIDLVTLNEGVSDLVMFVRVTEEAGNYSFKIEDVHVP